MCLPHLLTIITFFLWDITLYKKLANEEMSSEDYVKIVVDSVQLQSTAYEDNYAVSKSYVDGVKSDIMGGLAPEALDTIKELAEYMADGTVAGGLVTQLSSLSAQISDEAKRAVAVESDLSYNIWLNLLPNRIP